jgi:predicted dehydrogenase
MPDLKAAVIGTGGAAQLHLAAYARSPHTAPVAVVSHSAERAAALAAGHGIRPYTSVEAMLAAERPDVVSVATLEWDHEAPVLASLAAGASVLCEKIMADTLASGERMLAAARAAKRTLGVNYNYRAVPAHRMILECLALNHFGPPVLFSTVTHAYLWPHMLDLMLFFFGDPAEVSGTLVDDQGLRPPVSAGPLGRPWEFGEGGEMLYHPSISASATIRFRNENRPYFPKLLATISSSALVPLEDHFWSFSLFGRDRAVSVDAATRANLNGTPRLGELAATIAKLPPYSYEQSFADSVTAFVEAVREGWPAPVSGEEGLAALRLDAAITEAMRTGRTMKLPGATANS